MSLALSPASRAQEPSPAPPAAEPSEARAAPFTFSKFVLEEDAKFIAQSDEGTRQFVLDHLRSRGVDVRGGESALFETDWGREAPLVLGATISEVHWANSARSHELEIRFQWELMDARTRQVVYTSSTVGYAAGPRLVQQVTVWRSAPDADGTHVVTTTTHPSVPRQDIDRCITDGLDRLIARDAFTEVLVAAGRDHPAGDAEAALPAATTWPPLRIRACDADRHLPADFEGLLDAVVTLRSPDGGHGTAAFISPDGFALTAAHVVEGGVTTMRLRQGIEVPLEVLRVDEANDLALVRTAGTGYRCIPLGGAPQIGADVWAVGTPLSAELDLSVSRGIVSGLRTIGGLKLVQTDTAISPGYSGGPLVDERGEAIGVISFKLVTEGAEGVGFAIPATVVPERLALELGTSSDDPLALPPAPALAATGPIRADLDDPSRIGELTPDLREQLTRTSSTRIGAGVALLAGGAALAGGASALWRSDPGKSSADAAGLHVLDVLGWGAMLSGVPLIVLGGVSRGGL